MPTTKLTGGKRYKSKPNGKGVGHFEIYYNPPVKKDYTEGVNKNPNPEGREEYPNHLKDELDAELEQARRLGVKPISPMDANKFDVIINEGTIKWAVDKDGNLKVMGKIKFGEELKHPVLTEGKPVLAAGEADIVGNVTDGYYILEFNNYSGHFKPSLKSLEIGKTKFREIITILNDF